MELNVLLTYGTVMVHLHNGNSSWGPDCSNGADEVLDECCAAGLYDDSTCSGDGPQDPEECVEGYCPEGTYWDGNTCYDCDWCLNNYDDSACSAESGLDCDGACGDGGGEPVDCDLGWELFIQFNFI